ncbi:MAG: signal peptidase I [Proteobacteria bacterium]|nr:signal peptidase I [Pseudomonadota bacterium]
MTQEHDTEFSDVPDTGPSYEESTSGGKKQLPFWLELPLLIGIALVVAVVIKTFLFQAFYIPSSSMENTLQINDRVLVNKVTYEIGDISRQDVIVFDDPRGGFEQPDEDAIDSAVRNLLESIGLATPQSEFIKRVIGVPGDVVEANNGDLIVNGVAQDEPYRKNPERPIPDFAPVLVPEGHLFVMGDNRAASQDSRFFGPIPIDTVVGKAFVIIWPPSRWSGI